MSEETGHVTAGDALAAITEAHLEAGEDPSSTMRMIGDIMDFNRRASDSVLNSLYEGEKHAHEVTKAKLVQEYRRRDLCESRMEWLFGKIDSEELAWRERGILDGDWGE